MRGEVEIPPIESEQALAGQFEGWFASQGRTEELRRFRDELGVGFAALLPHTVNLVIEPRHLRIARLRIVTGNEVLAWMGDAAIFVVPHEGVVSGRGVGYGREPFLGRHQMIREFHQVRMVQGKSDIAEDRALAHHRGRPTDDALETPPHRVFLASVGRFPWIVIDTGLERRSRRVGTDDA
ncbi:MAG: hypothetical protein CSYNP_04474 [Syntrophus sp. SKADARSKE-3]|nr:hypothetical protein [Syntrophus sp. SKADARSKE-3]